MIIETDDISLHRGDDKTLKGTLVDKSENPVDLTGAGLKFSVKRRLADVTALIEKDSGTASEILITSPATGEFEVFLVPADTANLLDKIQYEYDIQLTTSAGKKYTIAIVPVMRIDTIVWVQSRLVTAI